MADHCCRTALDLALSCCAGKRQREESVIHVVGDQLDDLTPRLHARDDTGAPETRRAPKTALRIVSKAARF
jgi:hypothetical protein